MPVSKPVMISVVATAVLLLDHEPPKVASLNVVVTPWQINVVPVIANGSGLTVTVVNTKQPPVVV